MHSVIYAPWTDDANKDTVWWEPQEPRGPCRGWRHRPSCSIANLLSVCMGVREIAPKTETRTTKRQICFGVQDVPTVTRLSVRKECIVWTSLMSWASPKVKYATSLPASAAAMSWINAEKETSRTKRLLLVLLVLVVKGFIIITQLI